MLSLLSRLTRERPERIQARQLYLAVVAQSREPGFYLAGGVPDTLDGRFDMIALHTFLVLRRLKAEGEAGAPLAQALFDAMCNDMDENLRQLGVGDLGVGRRVKRMAQALYGRISAYESGLTDGDAALAAALLRNLYRGEDPGPTAIGLMVLYLRESDRILASAPMAALTAGRPSFAEVPHDV